MVYYKNLLSSYIISRSPLVYPYLPCILLEVYRTLLDPRCEEELPGTRTLQCTENSHPRRPAVRIAQSNLLHDPVAWPKETPHAIGLEFFGHIIKHAPLAFK